MKRLHIFLLLFFMLSSLYASAFNPYVRNWSSADYEAANQNWVLAQDSKGVVYAGNHKGLLEFDGFRWTLHQIGRGDIVRSVYVDSDDRVYVGAQNGFGFFERDAAGRLNYTDLSEGVVLPEGKKDRQAWSIVEVDGNIMFQTYWGCFLYDGKEVSCTETHFQLNRLSRIGDRIYYFHRAEILEFDDGHFQRPERGRSKVAIKSIVSFFHKPGHLLGVTDKGGLMLYDGKSYSKWNTEADEILRRATPNRAVMTRDSILVVGTVLDGVLAIDASGKVLWHINADNGLQNNTVLDILCDRDNNIWLALDYGISMVTDGKSVSVKSLDHNVGSVFDAEYFGDYIYIATNQGLYRTLKSSYDGGVELVPGMEGFVLSLYDAGDRLIVGHGTKTVMVSPDGKVHGLSEKGGGMCVKPFVVDGKEYIMVSSYTAMSVYGKDSGGDWHFLYDMEGFDSPVRYFETDSDGRIWAAHSRSGLYCIETDHERRKALSVTFYPSPSSSRDSRTGVFKVKDRLVFTDSEKCWVYDGLRYEIVPYDLLNDGLGAFASAHNIVPAGRNEYWFITDKAAALVRLSGSQIPEILKTLTYKEYGFIMLDGRENMVPVDTGHSMLCVHNAVALVSHDGETADDLHGDVYLAEVTVSSDGMEKACLDLSAEKSPSVDHLSNNISFGVTYPVYGSRPTVRYRLVGLDAGWNDIPGNGTVEYNRVPHGHYTFELCYEGGDVLVSWPFTVRPPFYASVWAWGLYILGFIGIVMLSVFLTRKGNVAAMRRLKEKNEQEIIKIENERLQDEIAFKGKQLASSSMNLIRRSEMLQELLEELDRQKDVLGSQYPNKYYVKMKSMIEDNMSSDEEWEVFQANFDLIHDGFFRNLSSRYPDLSASDLKLCALLRLNMDTKEIAKMINITVRGVETRRYRLRQKLGLHQEDSLSKFLMDIK